MKDFKYDLGATVADVITGFTGIVIGRSDWLTGQITYGVKSTELKDGIPLETEWLNQKELTLVQCNDNIILKD
jgi:hypothetical protein